MAGAAKRWYAYHGWSTVARAGYAWRKRHWHELALHAAHLQAAGIVHHARATDGVLPLFCNLASRPIDQVVVDRLAARLDKLEVTVSFHEEAIVALEEAQSTACMQVGEEAAAEETCVGEDAGSRQHAVVADTGTVGAFTEGASTLVLAEAVLQGYAVELSSQLQSEAPSSSAVMPSLQVDLRSH